MLSLSHYSNAETLVPHSTFADKDRWTRHDKPTGLWVSVDGPDDWAAWNESEQFRDTSQQNQFRVTLAEDANVLMLDSDDAILKFTDEYVALELGYGTYAVDWRAVASRYQGIIVAPYQWGLRYAQEARWYGGWDCASGCLWDASAISTVSLVRPMSDAGREKSQPDARTLPSCLRSLAAVGGDACTRPSSSGTSESLSRLPTGSLRLLQHHSESRPNERLGASLHRNRSAT